MKSTRTNAALQRGMECERTLEAERPFLPWLVFALRLHKTPDFAIKK